MVDKLLSSLTVDLSVQNKKNHLVGLFDFRDYSDIVSALSNVLGFSRDEISERLFYEIMQAGWNVTKAAQSFGITPHVYNDLMENFYQKTDTFVFDSLVSHLGRYCQEIDRRISEVIEDYFDGSKDLRILVFGDGIGTDSLRFAATGYQVTYFELKNYSFSFAQYRFKRQQLNHRIELIHNVEDIPFNRFDVIVCREVLEHVNDPLGVIKNIWNYLKDNGIGIITESFGRVEPYLPTHLFKNKKYNGKTKTLFVNAGFRILKSFDDERPMIFQKTDLSDQSRFRSLKRRKYIVRNIIRHMGRHILNRIQF